MEKLFGIFAFIMLLFVFSALTITTEYLTPFGTVTVSVSPTVFEWTVSVNADDYRTESYFEVHSPGFYVLVTDGHAPKGQFTVRILSSSNRVVYEAQAAHVHPQNKIYLEPGRYLISVTSKTPNTPATPSTSLVQTDPDSYGSVARLLHK